MYEQTIKRIDSRRKELTGEQILTEIDLAFTRAMRGNPPPLVEDLKARYLDTVDTGDCDTLFTVGYHLADVVDLFSRDLDNSAGFSDEELDYIKELINDFAVDMDISTVEHVMRLVVSRGLI